MYDRAPDFNGKTMIIERIVCVSILIIVIILNRDDFDVSKKNIELWWFCYFKKILNRDNHKVIVVGRTSTTTSFKKKILDCLFSPCDSANVTKYNVSWKNSYGVLSSGGKRFSPLMKYLMVYTIILELCLNIFVGRLWNQWWVMVSVGLKASSRKWCKSLCM